MELSTLRHLDCVPLDECGLGFIRQRLEWGGVLRKALDELVASASGRVVAYAPVGADRERLHQFEEGGLLAENVDPLSSAKIQLDDGSTLVPVATLFDEEFSRLTALLRADPSRACIVNDPMPKRGDPRLDEYQTKFYVDDEVYQLVTGQTAEDVAKKALKASPPWDCVNAIVRARLSIGPDLQVSAAALRNAAHTAVEVSCSAYDGEGYVVWKRAV